MQNWFKVKIAARYAGISERTARDWLKNGLRHSRLESGLILIKAQWLDEYLEAREVKENQVETIVESVLRAM